MSESVKARIIRIGNSQGVRIPKHLIEMSGLDQEVELIVGPGQLVIRSARMFRSGWEEKFKAAARINDDVSFVTATGLNAFDDEEWEWE
jgi:antitoxin MazE